MVRDAVEFEFCYTRFGSPVRSGTGDIGVEREQ
jgi:hypothetical protein